MTEAEREREEEAYHRAEEARIQTVLDRLTAHPGFYEAARYGHEELEGVIWRAISEGRIDGEISVEELLESMGDKGCLGGQWDDIVDSWRERFRENDRLIREEMHLERQNELRAYLGESTWSYCMEQAQRVKEFKSNRILARPEFNRTDEELRKMAAEIDFDSLFQ